MTPKGVQLHLRGEDQRAEGRVLGSRMILPVLAQESFDEALAFYLGHDHHIALLDAEENGPTRHYPRERSPYRTSQ